MQQQPLTPAGVDNKTAELYALPNNALLTEANAVRTDFIAWLNVNFVLNASQLTWLNGMDARWIAYAAYSTGFAFENRLPVVFNAPVPLPPASISKMAVVENKYHIEYSQIIGFAPIGHLEFTLTY
ncbi:hypothetical protein D3C87_298870 [compost metagenome]